MLRSDFYRQLEEQRKLLEAEKKPLMERIASLQAETGREEGMRIQLERTVEGLQGRIVETERAFEAERALARQRQNKADDDMGFYLDKTQRLEKELNTARRDVESREERIRELESVRETSVVVIDTIQFISGSAELSETMASRLAGLEERFFSAIHLSVLGYTDNREVAGSAFKSNWALSGARAASVVTYLNEKMNISERKVSVVARGILETKMPNDTPENRERNRRVEIIAVYR